MLTSSRWDSRTDSSAVAVAGFDPATGRGTVVGVTTTGRDLAGGPDERAYATRLGPDARALYDCAARR